MSVEKWRLDQPDLRIHSLLIQRLAECLRVSDANKMIGYISRVGVSPGEEVIHSPSFCLSFKFCFCLCGFH